MLCIIDSDLFADTPQARRVLADHRAILEQDPAIRVVTSVRYQQAVSRFIDPATRGFLFTRLQQMGRLVSVRDIPEDMANQPSDSLAIFGENNLISPADLRKLCLALQQNIDNYLYNPEEEIKIASLLKQNLSVRDQYGHVVEKNGWKIELVNAGRVYDVFIICSQRNWQVEWTIRYSDDLPDHGSFRFCPILDWKNNQPIVRTFNGRTGWIDACGNIWQEPQHVNGHHWDLQLVSRRSIEHYGLNQLNIGKSGDLREGEIHHIPDEKRALLRTDIGWRECN